VAYLSSNHSSTVGFLPDSRHTTSVGGDGFPGTSNGLAPHSEELLPDKERVPAVCLEMGNAGEYVLCRIGLAYLGKR
jgi:hypothetical protein